LFGAGADVDPIKLYISASEPADMTDLKDGIYRIGSDVA